MDFSELFIVTVTVNCPALSEKIIHENAFVTFKFNLDTIQ